MKILRSFSFSITLHTLIWSLLLGIPALLLPDGTFFGLSKSFFFISTVYHIGFFYLNAFFLYPKLLTKKRWWLYIICIAVIIVFSYHLKIYLLQPNPQFVPGFENQRIIAFGIIPFLAASILFRLVSDRIRFEKSEKEARAQRLNAELKFLRSQVSPHFLFNMLTNMVSLARQKSDLLEPSLVRLSELLRYMLYDSAEGKISVDREIEHLENYIGLQQLRFGADVQVKWEIKNDSPACMVEPMLLVPFIENAFKHGIGMLINPFIEIRLDIKDRVLKFSVKNNYNPGDISKDRNSGIGLVNVNNRLELLYPGKYQLVTKDEQGVFFVQLNLDLS